jgi:lambda family phage tail tape measure protein
MAGISAIALSAAARGGLVGLALFGGFELGEYLSKFQAVKDAMGEMFTPLFGVMAEMQKFFEKYDSKDRRVVKEGGYDSNGNYAPAQYETNAERAARQAAEARAAQGSFNAGGESRTLRQMEAGYTNTQAVRATSASGGMPTGTSHYIPREQKQAEQEAEIAVTLENARYRREEADLKASYDTRMSMHARVPQRRHDERHRLQREGVRAQRRVRAVAEQELRTHVTNLIAQRQILLGKHRDTAKIDADIAKANDDLNNTVLKNQTRAVSDAANEWKKFNEQTQSVIDTAQKGNVELKDEVEALKNHTKEKKDNILASLDARLVIEKETLARLESEQATWDICKALTAEQEAKKGEIETAKKAIDTMQAERNARKGLLTERKQLESNWINGAIKGLQDYEDKSLSTAKIMESAFKKAFTGLEDLIVNWVTHGKANIHEFLNSIGQDILRMLVKLNITQPLANFFQGLLSGSGSGGGGGIIGAIVSLLGGGGSGSSSGGSAGNTFTGVGNAVSSLGTIGSFAQGVWTGNGTGLAGGAGAYVGSHIGATGLGGYLVGTPGYALPRARPAPCWAAPTASSARPVS